MEAILAGLAVLVSLLAAAFVKGAKSKENEMAAESNKQALEDIKEVKQHAEETSKLSDNDLADRMLDD